MGIYRCARIDEHAAIFVHEPENHGSQVIEVRNPGASWSGIPAATQVGDRFTISMSFSKYTVESSAPVVEPLPNTVQHEAHLAAAAAASAGPVEVTEDTEEPESAEDDATGVSPDPDATEGTGEHS